MNMKHYTTEKKIESLYLHFPFCKHLCNYCDFYKKTFLDRPSEINSFHRYLENSFLAHEQLIKKNGYEWGDLKTIYIGGGTPSLWGEEGVIFLREFFDRHSLKIKNDCEFTLEINPGSWTEKSLERWNEVGVNRYSLGVQSLDEAMLKYLDRAHSLKEVYETLNYFQKTKANYSLDFMLGLPHSKEEGRNILDELKKSLFFNPSHFSVYILTVKNNYKHYESLPVEEWIEKEYLEASSFLQENGFKHYEVSNFSLPGFESRHNLAYWQSETVAGLGPSATGFLKEEKIRYKWKTREPEMEQEKLTDEEFSLEALYMDLRAGGVELERIANSSLWDSWITKKYAIIDRAGHLKLTSRGYLILDSLMNEIFFAERNKTC